MKKKKKCYRVRREVRRERSNPSRNERRIFTNCREPK